MAAPPGPWSNLSFVSLFPLGSLVRGVETLHPGIQGEPHSNELLFSLVCEQWLLEVVPCCDFCFLHLAPPPLMFP